MVSSILRRLKRRLRQLSKRPARYRYNGFFIELPADHRLPEYRRAFANYDRFLPHLASYVDRSGTIVDIGANVGDTLAGMIERNPAPAYICIEPDELFHRYLVSNAARIRNALSGARIRIVQALVGKSISNVRLDGSGGTKHAVADGTGTIRSSPLDELIADAAELTIRILKSDVDGYDYDVLNASLAVINAHAPMLFFECYTPYEHQKEGFSQTFRSLEAIGYRDWCLFDNFGELILRTGDLAVIDQLLEYVWTQNCGSAARTIHYYDILAVQAKDSALIDTVLAEYCAPGGG